jgi:hypothetical protein
MERGRGTSHAFTPVRGSGKSGIKRKGNLPKITPKIKIALKYILLFRVP